MDLVDKTQRNIIISGTIGIVAVNDQWGTSVGYMSEDGGFSGGGMGTITCNYGDAFIRGIFTDDTYRVMFYANNDESKYMLYPYTWSNIRITIGSRSVDTGSHSMHDGGVNLIPGNSSNSTLLSFAKYFYGLRGNYNYKVEFIK